MITDRTLDTARKAAIELRQRGEIDRADAIEALVAATKDEAMPALDLLTTSEAGELLGVTGQTIKNWVRAGKLAGYRVGGRIMIPQEVVASYVQQARQSLDLEEMPDEAAADLVAAGRARGR